MWDREHAHALIIVGKILGIEDDRVNADITEDTGLTNYAELRDEVERNEVSETTLAMITVADSSLGNPLKDILARKLGK